MLFHLFHLGLARFIHAYFLSIERSGTLTGLLTHFHPRAGSPTSDYF